MKLNDIAEYLIKTVCEVVIKDQFQEVSSLMLKRLKKWILNFVTSKNMMFHSFKRVIASIIKHDTYAHEDSNKLLNIYVIDVNKFYKYCFSDIYVTKDLKNII